MIIKKDGMVYTYCDGIDCGVLLNNADEYITDDDKQYCEKCFNKKFRSTKDLIVVERIDMRHRETKDDPFKFVSKILDMSLETQMEIFPETGSTENIFRYFTYDEAKERYNNWYNGYIQKKGLE